MWVFWLWYYVFNLFLDEYVGLANVQRRHSHIQKLVIYFGVVYT